MQTQTGIEQALSLCDNSPTKLAAAIGNGVLRQHVEHWIKAQKVPADKAPDVMVATGVPIDQLCPGPNWGAVLKMRKYVKAA